MKKNDIYTRYLKRSIDLILAVALITALSLLFVLISILLFITNKGKIFYIQSRPGYHGNLFRVLKFKTMTDECDENGTLLPNSERLTKIGKFLRSSSLDEIPQLINVLKGDMSFVGPRPLSLRYLTLYNKRQMMRHDVKPGITGWAQINGRNNIPWVDRFEMDVWYVENSSAMLDFKILLKTVIKVVKRDDIDSKYNVGAKPFNGNN